MRYSSFLVRRWQLPAGRERVDVEHVQSGQRASVGSLADALGWMDGAPASHEDAQKAARGREAMGDEQGPEVETVLDVPGQACATLTPLIKAAIRELASGQVLEVRSDDPAAREGVPAWSRLTGNPLVATVVEESGRTRFYLRKK